MNDSDNHHTSKIILAKWKDRFFAWIIDFIIISLISTAIVFVSFLSLSYNFENFITTWDEYLTDIHEREGSWANRKNYNSYGFLEIT